MLLCSGLALASPATDLFQAASQALMTNYYGWSDTDRAELVSRYSAQLGVDCQLSGDACTFDQGRAVIKTMLAQLHDAHTNIRDAEGAERLREIQEDLIVPRTGVRVVKTPLGLLVVGVMPGSPAAQAGVQRFDLLTEVAGQSQEGGRADSAAFVRLERRQAPLQVTLERAGELRALTLNTAPLKARDVPILSWQQAPAGQVAVIEYPSFLPGDSAELFLKVLGQAKAAGATGLVIDLRYNGGGRLDQCVQAASAFLPTLYQARWQTAQTAANAGKEKIQGSWDYAALDGHLAAPGLVRKALATGETGTALWKGPAALLIGENTASCAEVFGHFAHEAGALLVGQPTKGVMNSGVNFFPLPDHGVMSVTMLRAYDLAGQPLPERLQPDLNAPADLDALTLQGQDSALQAALGAVQSRLAGNPAPASAP
jgi:carboxyl-terminal processing protease